MVILKGSLLESFRPKTGRGLSYVIDLGLGFVFKYPRLQESGHPALRRRHLPSSIESTAGQSQPLNRTESNFDGPRHSIESTATPPIPEIYVEGLCVLNCYSRYQLRTDDCTNQRLQTVRTMKIESIPMCMPSLIPSHHARHH